VIDAEERAWELLRWGSRAPLAPFDEELAAEGFYTRVQKERSDAALDEWDKKNPYDADTELSAFHELESIGVLTKADFFSPDKANRSPRYIDPKDRDKGEKYTTTSYKDDLKQQRTQVNKATDRRNSRGPIPSEGRVQSGRVSNCDQGRIETSGITDRFSERRKYRKGSLRKSQSS
jgi:hypothetical protein